MSRKRAKTHAQMNGLVVRAQQLVTDDERRQETGQIGDRTGRQQVGRQQVGRLQLGRLQLGRQQLGRQQVGRLQLGRQQVGRQQVGRRQLSTVYIHSAAQCNQDCIGALCVLPSNQSIAAIIDIIHTQHCLNTKPSHLNTQLRCTAQHSAWRV